MLRYEDCLPLAALDDNERLALADHPPDRDEVCLDLGQYVLLDDDGEPAVSNSLLADLAACQAARNVRRTAELKLMLRTFVDNHPRRRVGAR